MLDNDQKKLLSAFVSIGKPASGKEAAAASGLDEKLVGKLITKLKTQGFVDSPVRCKYGITEAGKNQL
jgi:hypothetical protein